MNIILIFLAFMAGTVAGSFINAWVYRVREGLPLTGRSFCPECKHTLAVADLVPLLSFLLLRGKCRYCSKPISPRYPIVEISAGVLFAASFVFFFGTQDLIMTPLIVVSFASQVVLITVLLALFAYDLAYLELPDRIVITGIILSATAAAAKFAAGVWEFRELTGRLPIGEYLLANPDFVWRHVLDLAMPYLLGVLAGLVLAVIFYLIVVLSRERMMGGGDIKLAILLGLILPWPYLVPALYVGFILGAGVGLGLVVFGRKKIRSIIPLGPFLVIGVIATMFFGDSLLQVLFPVI